MPEPVVVATAMLRCSFGLGEAPLVVEPEGPPVVADGMPVANINHHLPLVNITTFDMCSAPDNPEVVAADGAPMPCVPMTELVPWTPGNPTVLVDGVPIINATSVCECLYGGVITVSEPGQFQTLA